MMKTESQFAHFWTKVHESLSHLSFTTPVTCSKNLFSITNDMANSIAVAMIHSSLDYASSLLYGISASNIHKLCRCQDNDKVVVLPSHLTTVIYSFCSINHGGLVSLAPNQHLD